MPSAVEQAAPGPGAEHERRRRATSARSHAPRHRRRRPQPAARPARPSPDRPGGAGAPPARRHARRSTPEVARRPALSATGTAPAGRAHGDRPAAPAGRDARGRPGRRPALTRAQGRPSPRSSGERVVDRHPLGDAAEVQRTPAGRCHAAGRAVHHDAAARRRPAPARARGRPARRGHLLEAAVVAERRASGRPAPGRTLRPSPGPRPGPPRPREQDLPGRRRAARTAALRRLRPRLGPEAAEDGLALGEEARHASLRRSAASRGTITSTRVPIAAKNALRRPVTTPRSSASGRPTARRARRRRPAGPPRARRGGRRGWRRPRTATRRPTARRPRATQRCRHRPPSGRPPGPRTPPASPARRRSRPCGAAGERAAMRSAGVDGASGIDRKVGRSCEATGKACGETIKRALPACVIVPSVATVYVTGHRNPDLDSIASAIGYAELRERLDPANRYVPVRLGELNAQAALGAGAQRRPRARVPRRTSACARSDVMRRDHPDGAPRRLAARRRPRDGEGRRRHHPHPRRRGGGRRHPHDPRPRPPLHQGVERALELRRPAGLGRPDRGGARRAHAGAAHPAAQRPPLGRDR